MPTDDETRHDDDPRRIDWKQWSKTDRYYVKQYEEDTNLRATLLVDLSGSMAYGKAPLNKREYACTLAASLAYLLLRQQDAVGCLAFSDRTRVRVPQRTKRGHLVDIVRALAQHEPAEKTDFETILQDAAESYPRRGLMMLISDLLAERHGLFRRR
mgnify:CR=1 FL=1